MELKHAKDLQEDYDLLESHQRWGITLNPKQVCGYIERIDKSEDLSAQLAEALRHLLEHWQLKGSADRIMAEKKAFYLLQNYDMRWDDHLEESRAALAAYDAARGCEVKEVCRPGAICPSWNDTAWTCGRTGQACGSGVQTPQCPKEASNG